MNVLGFYDLGGNVREWMWDGLDEKTGKPLVRGGGWAGSLEYYTVVSRRSDYFNPECRSGDSGFRVALSSVP